MQGKFLVIEGLDGAGKSTAMQFIKNFFAEKKIQAIYTREPGGTKIAEELRNLILHNNYDEEIHPDAELLMIYAGRVQHSRNLILPALEQGVNVVSDRFYWSSIAYQGGGRGLNLEKIDVLNSNFLGNCEPDLVIYLDIEPLVGLQRAKKVDSPDRIEQAGLEFFERTRSIFKKLVKTSSNAIEIDASLPLEEIQRRIHQILNEYF
ncbi:dTMP kinase [Allofrancisella guangzhouensis]|uniref:Thymidylate kinase n=1 Tax=Allofrancisella guangzhouensis TaxID=594679 RepID=A0A0A8E3M7_9GAMM|nr:dTMP kinase [Allofrancisella guangzhouensis]AJC48222.1 thymidylate kinase [Allofrancisella guangzhouensis]MBK2027158.1 dTMP kinase [Allofrancisella guangzhouensis]MBK2044582.1 dTMP kinase [Allofrancisella guangzhouensis]MBK2046000.1 dTMP kinase [Allofrancisella guangzhouensis]